MKVLMLLLLAGCGVQPSPAPVAPAEAAYYQVGEEFEPYVEMFREAATRQHHDLGNQSLMIVFNGDDSLATRSAGAECGMRFGINQMIVQRSVWEGLNEDARAYIIFHELGHCWLHRGHDNIMLPGGTQESIMYYKLINATAAMGIERDYYEQELFNGGGK